MYAFEGQKILGSSTFLAPFAVSALLREREVKNLLRRDQGWWYCKHWVVGHDIKSVAATNTIVTFLLQNVQNA
jgi:hypothetical protein